MNGATREDTRAALSPADYVNQAGVWVPQSSVPAPAPLTPASTPARLMPQASPAPGPLADQGGHAVTIGTGDGQLSAATGLQPAPAAVRPAAAAAGGRRAWWRLPAATPVSEEVPEELPDGVLGRITNGMAAAIGVVALVGMAEAAFNLGRFVLEILSLPLPLAIGMPAVFELTAATYAIQDARDRRQGHANTAMRVATYLTLVASSAVNGIVGYASHGLAGLIEIVPPLMLAGVIHLHGDRATRAFQSRAVLRPAWREAQLKAARRESVMDVLPLLAGDDEHGRATVELLRRRLDSETLEPGDALLAAGWFERFDRAMKPSMLRRLETVAATVWGSTGPPSPVRPPAPEPVRRPQPAGTTGATAGRSGAGSSGAPSSRSSGSSSGSARGSSSGSASRPTGTTAGTTRGSGTKPASGAPGSARTVQQLRARTFEDLIAELETAVEAGSLSTDSSPRAIRDQLKVNATRAVALHTHLQQIAATPPHLRVLHSPDQASSPTQAGDGSVSASDAEQAR
jgi:hypothetical protein